ncbi:MAG: GLPGLI family protein [Marinifilaceae bacterium]
MRIIYLAITFLFIMSSITSVSQTADLKGCGLKCDTISKVVLDNSKIRVYYLLNYLPNPAKPSSMQEAQTILQIGDKMNRFTDYNSFRSDSINDVSVKQKLPLGSYMMSMMGLNRKVNFHDNIIIDKIEEKVIYQRGVLLDTYEYEEDMPKLDWKILKGDTTFFSYKCNKAMTRYRGRTYIAWYASEINLPFGPYVFGGLPGLIFQVQDISNHYSFTLNGLRQTQKRDIIYKYNKKKIIRTKRDKVRKIYKNYCADPIKAIMNSGRTITISDKDKAGVKPKAYNPIELN